MNFRRLNWDGWSLHAKYNFYTAHRRDYVSDDVRGLGRDQIQTLPSLSGGLGQQEDL